MVNGSIDPVVQREREIRPARRTMMFRSGSSIVVLVVYFRPFVDRPRRTTNTNCIQWTEKRRRRTNFYDDLRRIRSSLEVRPWQFRTLLQIFPSLVSSLLFFMVQWSNFCWWLLNMSPVFSEEFEHEILVNIRKDRKKKKTDYCNIDEIVALSPSVFRISLRQNGFKNKN